MVRLRFLGPAHVVLGAIGSSGGPGQSCQFNPVTGQDPDIEDGAKTWTALQHVRKPFKTGDPFD